MKQKLFSKKNIYNICINLLFAGVCLGIAMYVSVDQIKFYWKNEDYSSFKIKDYAMEENSMYPDVSICLVKPRIGFYKKGKLPLNISMWDMMRLMQGDSENLENISTDVGAKILSEIANDRHKYEYFLSDRIYEIFNGSRLSSTNHFEAPEPNSTKSTLIISWLDAATLCFTHRIHYTPHDVLDSFNFYVKIERLQAFRHYFVYLHHPDQLIRRIGSIKSFGTMLKTSVFKTSVPRKYDNDYNLVQIAITNVKVILKRNKKDEICDETIFGDDDRWIQQAAIDVGCVPIFWADKISKDLKLNQCQTYNQYSRAALHASDFWNITQKFAPPCRYLNTLSSSQFGNAKILGLNPELRKKLNLYEALNFRILYKTNEYEEITHERLFNEWDLFGQIGGIVGIMLGFSFLQVPEMLLKVFTIVWLKAQSHELIY